MSTTLPAPDGELAGLGPKALASVAKMMRVDVVELVKSPAVPPSSTLPPRVPDSSVVLSTAILTPSPTLLKIVTRYFRKEISDFTAVHWRWSNHEVLLTPAFWVLMFITSPISSDQLV